ncbi:MAG: cation transporter [Verrucomicrobiaceae bacterium]|nr:cation transporter [Verrucomicrobiaceae bacterium]
MKLHTLLALVVFPFSAAQAAESITIDGVHNCCKSCENGIKKAVESVRGAKLASSTKTSATVEVKSKSDTKKVLEALMDGGYYGTVGSEASSAPASASAAPKVATATVSGVHLCCGKCATAAKEAVESVAGVKEHTVVSKAKTFDVKGDFAVADLVAALNKAGFHGKVK